MFIRDSRWVIELIYKRSSLDVLNTAACRGTFFDLGGFMSPGNVTFFFSATFPVTLFPGHERSGMKVISCIGEVKSQGKIACERKCIGGNVGIIFSNQ